MNDERLLRMTTNKRNFEDAYNLAFVDDDIAGAIALCEQIVNAEPSHLNARMLLGCLLSDSNDPEKRIMGRKHFITAIEFFSPDTNNKDMWLEENPFYQLALWEQRNGSKTAAAVIYAIDYALHKTKRSSESMNEMIQEGLSSEDRDRIKETLDAIFACMTPAPR
jgi:hypothetical protein